MKHDVAVIGMSVTLPKIKNLGDFWELITSGTDLVDEYPEYRREESDKFIRYLKNRSLKSVGGERTSFHNGCFLDDVEMFDYRFFNMTPKQASTTDPHHLLVMKTLYKALEDAGYAGDRIAKSDTGVFVGFANNPGQDYSSYVLNIDPNLAQVSLTGNVPCMLANRISHFLDIQGPSTIVDTACSASLVATLNAARSVADGYCRMALVGGTRVCTPVNEESSRIGIESFDGKTRSFDESADGTGLGEGSGAIVLKRLDHAIEDGDHIYSVIRGGAINHDGATEGITSPDSDSQARLLTAAWKDADVHPSSIQYLEAHGTATRIGDPIEINGMKRAFAQFDVAKDSCAIGTVKTNIGHLFEGSGVMGVIKTSLSLYHKKLSPVANFKKENPLLALKESPLYVSDQLREWDAAEGPRRAGVSAFGLGGTNCHVVFEEAPEIVCAQPSQQENLFVFSGLTEKSLKANIEAFSQWLQNDTNSDVSLAQAAYTLLVGRKHLPFRYAAVASSREMLIESLAAASSAAISKRSDSDIAEQLAPDANLTEAANAYIAGQKLNANALFEVAARRTVSLPAYQYDESACHVYFPKEANLIPDNFTEDNLHTYHVNYVKEKLDKGKLEPKDDKILLLDCEESKRSLELKAMLTMTGKSVTTARYGGAFDTTDKENITLENTEKDYELLAEFIRDEGIDHIIHVTKENDSPKNIEQLNNNVDVKLRSLFYLSREVVKRAIRCHFSIITENVARVDKNDKTNLTPENSAILGLSRVIPREAHFITVKAYDMDVQTPTRALLLELSVNSERRMVIYRDGERYVEQFDYLDVVSTRYSGVKVVEGGNYLITGGTGAIGMEVAKYLAKQNNVNLILASRSGLPARDQWDSVLQVGGKTADKVRKIKELESMGSSVTVYASDCGDIPQLEALVHAVKENHGNINGIVHAAGNPGKNVISMRETKDFEEVIYPKIQGTFLLHQLTREMNTDFMILFSSVAAIFPTAGQGDYAAANTYMDTFADQFNGSGTRIVSMQWAAWRDIGMAVDYLTNQDTTFKAIPTQQGIDCIDKALEHIPSRVFVGEVNYPNEIVQWLQEVGIKLSDDIDQKISLVLNKDRNPIASSGANAEQESLTEVELQGRASGDYSKTEQAIGSIWAEALGYEELNIEDEFLDLGGESITAMTIARAITDVLDITVDVGSLMEHSTISSLAQFIDKQSIAA